MYPSWWWWWLCAERCCAYLFVRWADAMWYCDWSPLVHVSKLLRVGMIVLLCAGRCSASTWCTPEDSGVQVQDGQNPRGKEEGCSQDQWPDGGKTVMTVSGLPLAGAATSIIFSQHFFTFVATNMFVMTKRVFCHDKSMLVSTKCLSWQTQVCCDRYLLLSRQKYVCHNKSFVVASILFSQQKKCFIATKWYLWQLPPMIQDSHATLVLWSVFEKRFCNHHLELFFFLSVFIYISGGGGAFKPTKYCRYVMKIKSQPGRYSENVLYLV